MGFKAIFGLKDYIRSHELYVITFYLSCDVASVSVITSCIKIDEP